MRSEAQKEAEARYIQQILKYQIKWNKAEAEEGERLKKHCEELDISVQKYIKQLIREDMKRNGY